MNTMNTSASCSSISFDFGYFSRRLFLSLDSLLRSHRQSTSDDEVSMKTIHKYFTENQKRVYLTPKSFLKVTMLKKNAPVDTHEIISTSETLLNDNHT